MCPHRVPQPGRLRRALGRVGAGAGLLVLFTGATVVGAVLALDTPPARRIVVRTVNKVLHGAFAGEVVVSALEDLSLHGIKIRDAVVRDPRGDEALSVTGIQVRFDALPLAREALLGRGDLAITLDALEIDRAAIVTARGPDGALTLQESFEPRTPSAAPSPEGRKLHLRIAKIHVGRAWIHGDIAPPRAIDAEVHDLHGVFSLDPSGISVTIDPTSVLERRALPAPIAGFLGGSLRTHDEGALSAIGSFRGKIGDTEVALHGAMDGDRVQAIAAIPELTPAALTVLVPGAPLTRPIALTVRAQGALPALSVEAELNEVRAPERALHAEAEIDLGKPLQVKADVTTRAMDPRLFAAQAPTGAIYSHTRATITLPEGPPRVVAHVDAAPSLIAGQRTPAITAQIDLDHGAVRGAFAARERGLTMEGRVALTKDQRASFDVRAAVPAIHAAPRLRALIGDKIDGGARVHVQGTFARGAIDARIQGDGAVTPGTLSIALRRFDLAAHVHGPLDALAAEGEVHGEGIAAFDAAADRLDVRLAGALRPAPEARIALSIDEGAYAQVHGLSARLVTTLHGDEIAAEGAVSLEGQTLRLERAVATLHGSPTDPRAYRDLAGAAEITAEGLDLAALARLAPVELPRAVSAISGLVDARLVVSREPGERLPSVKDLAIRTTGLTVAGEKDPDTGAPAWDAHCFDVALRAALRGDTGLVRGRLEIVDAQRGAPVVAADLAARADIDALLGQKAAAGLPSNVGRGSAFAFPLSGGVRAQILRLPLERLPFPNQQPVNGELSGSASIEVNGHLGRAALDATLDGRDQSRLGASFDVGLRFDEGKGPSADKTRPAEAMVSAQGFRLATLQPLIGDAVDHLDGHLDGRLALRWARFNELRDASVKGALRVTSGTAAIPAIGQDLRDIEITLSADPRSIVRIERIAARGTRGSFRGSAEARFVGLDLVNAHAALEIQKGQDLPLTVGGVPLGDIHGRVQAEALHQGDQLNVAVAIPELSLTLPPSLNKHLQQLDPNPDITITPSITPPEGKPKRGGDALRVAVGVDLGAIQIKGNGADITLGKNEGAPIRITLDGEPQVSGDIKVTRGKVEVLGKVFEIEPGSLVHLRPEDKSNPFLNIAANWTAPDGTSVKLSYLGTLDPITPEKLKLTSEPPRSQQELMALIFLGPEYEEGTVAGGPSTGPSQTAVEAAGGAAASLGGSYVSGQINQILSGIAPLEGLSVKLAPEGTTGLKTTLGYRFSSTLSATATFDSQAGSASASGASPGAAGAAPGAAVSLEWRFKPRWSIRASVGVGDLPSTSLDLLWTKRY